MKLSCDAGLSVAALRDPHGQVNAVERVPSPDMPIKSQYRVSAHLEHAAWFSSRRKCAAIHGASGFTS